MTFNLFRTEKKTKSRMKEMTLIMMLEKKMTVMRMMGMNMMTKILERAKANYRATSTKMKKREMTMTFQNQV